jgi:serine/threonine-protein kinase RsbW
MTFPVPHIEESMIAAKEFVDVRTVRVRMGEGADPNRAIESLQTLFDDLFRNGVTRVLFDMRHVEYPNASFIAFLIQRTVEARRLNGDIQLLNLSLNAKNHVSLFSPLTFLSFEDEPGPEAGEKPAPSGSEPGKGEFVAVEEGVPYKLQVGATLDALNKLTDFVTSLAWGAGFEKLEVSRLKIAVYEAGMNVIEHGYEFAPDETLYVEVTKETDRFLVVLGDTGRSFDFSENPVYDAEEAFREKRRGGFGRYIIERSVDEVYYKGGEKGNRLTLVKYLNKN